MPTPLDLAFALLFTLVITTFDTIYFVPRFKAAVAAGVRGARLHAYRRTVIGQWAFAAMAILLWAHSGRSWSDLGVVRPAGSRMIVSAVIIGLIVGLTAQQVRAIGRTTPERRLAIRPKLAYVDYLLPHSREELRWFSAQSITAGVCEELLYRGFLFWLLKAYVGVAAAAVIGVVLFGALHGHNQGESPVGLFSAGAVGLVFCISLWYTGSLWWAIGFHAAWDWGQTFFYGTPDSGMVARGHFLSEHPAGALLWSGGPTGPEGSLYIVPLLIIMALAMWLWWRRKPVAGPYDTTA